MTTDDRSVDVVVPAWGAYLRTLPEAVASAAGARVFAVVDPAGMDVARDAGCVAVPRPVGGVGPARNAGARAGNSAFVLFLDADDALLPGALDVMVARLSAAPRRVVAVTGALRRRSDGSAWPDARWARAACLPGGGPLLLFRNVLPAVGACLIRRVAMPADGLFPPLEDEDWHAVVTLRATGTMRCSAEQLLDYADGPGTVSRRPRDPVALAASHDRLVRSAGRRPWWRVVDTLARTTRRRADEALLSRWGRAGGA